MASMIRCDADHFCIGRITYVDTKGYGYCDPHGLQMKANGRTCRKLTPAERTRIEHGKTITWQPAPRALSARKLDDLIARLHSECCSGWQINILNIGKVFAAGHAAYARACSEADVRDAVIAAATIYREN